jgi:hypothetical protein
MTLERRAVYWVIHMEERDRQPNVVRKELLPPFAIQLLAPDGSPTEAITYVEQEDVCASIRGVPIPPQVIEVVRSLPEGEGRYLDATGQPITPF